jgi:hypothetical protein
MRTLAPTPAPSQAPTATAPIQPGRESAESRAPGLLPDRTGSIDHHPPDRRPHARAGPPPGEPPPSSHDFGRIAVHPRVPPLLPALPADAEQREPPSPADRSTTSKPGPYDFGRIPVFSPGHESIELSSPGDADERQADDVAARVVAGRAPILPPAPIGGTGAGKRLDGTGHGRPLDASTRGTMERMLGADLGGVRIHTGARADTLSRRLDAAAFTYGQDVYFRQGGFDPASRRGQGLLAHELTHTLQNRGKVSRRIQRKIMIAGSPYTPTAEDYGAYDKGLLDRMHNGGNEPGYGFATLDEFRHEVGMRTNAMKMVADVIDTHNTSVRFGFFNWKTGEFRLPEEFWERKNRKEYHLKQGTPHNPAITPANGIRSIFNNGRLETFLDCNMMLVAIQYKAMLDTYGDERFNKMFSGTPGLIIGQNKEDNPATPDVKEGYASTKSGSHPLFDQGLYERIDVPEGEDVVSRLLPGDWVYFKNAPDYLEYLDLYNQAMEESTLDPARYADFRHVAEWQGEHAIYLGERKIQPDENVGGEPKTAHGFAGFGLEKVESYDGMINTLTAACKFEYNALQLAKANDFKTDPNDISKVPDSVVKGKPRISTIFRLKTANVEALGN